MPGFGGGGLEQAQRAFPVALAVGEFGQQAQGVAIEGIGVEGPLGQLADVCDAGASAASGLSAGAWGAAFGLCGGGGGTRAARVEELLVVWAWRERCNSAHCSSASRINAVG